MPVSIEIDRTQEAPGTSGASSRGAPDGDAPVLTLELWPHSSLTPRGFVWAIGLLFGLLCLPLIALLGSVALWGILPFALAAVALLWLSLKRSWRDRDILERFELTREAARLTRRDPDGRSRDWEANPYWVRVELHPKDGPVEDYLTLEGGPRSVEIGAFLTPRERRDLRDRLRDALRAVRRPA